VSAPWGEIKLDRLAHDQSLHSRRWCGKPLQQSSPTGESTLGHSCAGWSGPPAGVVFVCVCVCMCVQWTENDATLLWRHIYVSMCGLVKIPAWKASPFEWLPVASRSRSLIKAFLCGRATLIVLSQHKWTNQADWMKSSIIGQLPFFTVPEQGVEMDGPGYQPAVTLVGFISFAIN